MSEDGWKWMTAPDQPRNCSSCGKKVRISKDTIWFARFPVPATYCNECMPVPWRACGCSYCDMALAAIGDAEEAHRSVAA